jgi:hypothetical protein
MNVRRFVTCGLAVLAVSASATARAATLDGIQGQVLVNRGGGYKRVRGPMVLKAGDSVVANSAGSAIVSYDDGCNVAVKSGAVVTIAAGPSPCAVQVGFKAPAGLTGSPGAPQPGGEDGTTLAALAVGGAIGATAFFLSRDDDDKRRPSLLAGGHQLPPGGNHPASPN